MGKDEAMGTEAIIKRNDNVLFVESNLLHPLAKCITVAIAFSVIPIVHKNAIVNLGAKDSVGGRHLGTHIGAL